MFPIPAHLPRKRDSDVSTKVLTKMSETSLKGLNYKLASEWVGELDAAILQTKVRRHVSVWQACTDGPSAKHPRPRSTRPTEL